MSLSHDGYAFLSVPHGPIVAEGPFELPIVPGQFFGVAGESHIIGEPYGRNLSCELTLQGYASIAALETALRALDAKAGSLTGTLTETIGANSRTFPQTTFIGFQQSPPGPFLDGSGVYGWVCFGRLIWRQRTRS